jgi:hypothetical protein
MPMRMPGPPSCTSSVPAPKGSLCVCPALMAADAAGDHDRLVVAALHAGHGLLEDAEVAAQVGAAELVVEGGAAQRALGHDLQRAGDVLGLADRVALPRFAVPGRCRLLTEKPVSPALGRAPRPVAPSSRISPPAPVAAPGKG